MNELIMLLSTVYTEDEVGNDIETKTEKQVFCQISSCSQNEFFQAAQSGMRAEYKVKVWKCDYENEPTAKINDVEYSIYRTFETGDFIELYLNKKVGTQ